MKRFLPHIPLLTLLSKGNLRRYISTENIRDALLPGSILLISLLYWLEGNSYRSSAHDTSAPAVSPTVIVSTLKEEWKTLKVWVAVPSSRIPSHLPHENIYKLLKSPPISPPSSPPPALSLSLSPPSPDTKKTAPTGCIAPAIDVYYLKAPRTSFLGFDSYESAQTYLDNPSFTLFESTHSHDIPLCPSQKRFVFGPHL